MKFDIEINGIIKYGMVMRKLVLSVLAMVFAAELFADTETVNGVTYTYSVFLGKATIGTNRYLAAIPTSTAGELVVPDRLGGYPVTEIGLYAFLDCAALTEVSLPKGVKEIGKEAFQGCTSLEAVSMPYGLREIGSCAFAGCKNLWSLKVPDSVSKIGCSAFSGTAFYEELPEGLIICGKGWLYGYKGECPASITLPESVKVIGDYAFSDCKTLESITIPKRVQLGRRVFSHCAALKTIHVGRGDKERIRKKLRAKECVPDVDAIEIVGEDYVYGPKEYCVIAALVLGLPLLYLVLLKLRKLFSQETDLE